MLGHGWPDADSRTSDDSCSTFSLLTGSSVCRKSWKIRYVFIMHPSYFLPGKFLSDAVKIYMHVRRCKQFTRTTRARRQKPTGKGCCLWLCTSYTAQGQLLKKRASRAEIHPGSACQPMCPGTKLGCLWGRSTFV